VQGTVEFRILGPLQVLSEFGDIEITATRQRAVLAILLLAANRVVSLDNLVNLLYHGVPPRRAVASVQAYISLLRRRLEPGRTRGCEPVVLRSVPGGYVLQVGAFDRDDWQFERALHGGQAALAGGRPDLAQVELDHGLALWRGSALGDLASEPFAMAEAARLEELRWIALEARLETGLALGAPELVAAEAELRVAEDPFRERLWHFLILSLYRVGRQRDALRACQQYRQFLRTELGLDPGPDLRRLESNVLDQAATLEWQPPLPATTNGPQVGHKRRGASSSTPGTTAERPPGRKGGAVTQDLERLLERGMAAWNDHDAEAYMVLLSDEIAWRDPLLPEPLNDKPSIRRYVEAWFTAFPDLVIIATRRVFSGDTMAVELEWTAVHRGPLQFGADEIPPTNRPVRARASFFARIKAGLVVELSLHSDPSDLMAQLGLNPAPLPQR
jgi:DNA-binding SARP family transcriptional activator/predicted ester cyclase